MTTSSWLRRLLSVTAAVALGSTGCSGGSAPQDIATEFTEYGESALVSVLEIDDSLARANETAVLYNELATSCLRERGFEVPQLMTEPIEPDPMLLAFQELGEEAFVLEHGFGVIDSTIISYNAPTTDTLNAYIETLSSTEAESFRLALFGDPFALDRSTTCSDISSRQVDEQLGAQRWDAFGQFSAEISERTNADSRVVALHQQYATCMSARGYDYRTPLEPARAAMDRFSAFMDERQMDDPRAQDLVASLSDESRDDLDLLIQQEIDEGSDSLACERSIRTQLVTLSRQIEQDWINENNDRIQAHLDE